MRLTHHTLNLHHPLTNEVRVSIDSLVVDFSKTCSLNELIRLHSALTIENFQPLLINSENQVVDGNKRLLVAIMNDWSKVPVIREGGYGKIDLDILFSSPMKVA
jgi:hypothetical protein